MITSKECAVFRSFSHWFNPNDLPDGIDDVDLTRLVWWGDLDIFLHALALCRKLDPPVSAQTSAEVAHGYANEVV